MMTTFTFRTVSGLNAGLFFYFSSTSPLCYRWINPPHSASRSWYLSLRLTLMSSPVFPVNIRPGVTHRLSPSVAVGLFSWKQTVCKNTDAQNQTLFIKKSGLLLPSLCHRSLVNLFSGSPVCSLDCAESAFNQIPALMESALVFY